MTGQLIATERTDRARMRWCYLAGLAVVGALLLLAGACSTAQQPGPPPAPAAAAAGTIDPAGPEAAASGGAGAPTAAGSAATPPRPNTATSATAATPSTSTPDSASTPTTAPIEPETAAAEGVSTTSTGRAGGAAGRPSAKGVPSLTNTVVVPTFAAATVTGPVLPASVPTSLSIPAIGVEGSPVLRMKPLPDGGIEVPPLEDTRSSGWYTGSPTPGEVGPSVILGHVDSAKNGPSVFYRLGELTPGDEVRIDRADGTLATFRVDAVREYPKNQFPTEVVYGNLDRAGLRLITCGGTFNPRSGHYESNVIAFASLVG